MKIVKLIEWLSSLLKMNKGGKNYDTSKNY